MAQYLAALAERAAGWGRGIAKPIHPRGAPRQETAKVRMIALSSNRRRRDPGMTLLQPSRPHFRHRSDQQVRIGMERRDAERFTRPGLDHRTGVKHQYVVANRPDC